VFLFSFCVPSLSYFCRFALLPPLSDCFITSPPPPTAKKKKKTTTVEKAEEKPAAVPQSAKDASACHASLSLCSRAFLPFVFFHHHRYKTPTSVSVSASLFPLFLVLLLFSVFFFLSFGWLWWCFTWQRQGDRPPSLFQVSFFHLAFFFWRSLLSTPSVLFTVFVGDGFPRFSSVAQPFAFVPANTLSLCACRHIALVFSCYRPLFAGPMWVWR
jgi:hypothetical protein